MFPFQGIIFVAVTLGGFPMENKPEKIYLIKFGKIVGGFPIEITTKIRYLIICSYLNFTR